MCVLQMQSDSLPCKQLRGTLRIFTLQTFINIPPRFSGKLCALLIVLWFSFIFDIGICWPACRPDRSSCSTSTLIAGITSTSSDTKTHLALTHTHARLRHNYDSRHSWLNNTRPRSHCTAYTNTHIRVGRDIFPSTQVNTHMQLNSYWRNYIFK